MRITLDDKSFTAGVFDSSFTFPDVKITKERTLSCYELEFFDENGGITYVNGTKHPIKSGTVLLARPGDVRYTELPLKAYYLKLSASEKSLAEIFSETPEAFTVSDIDVFVRIIKAIMTAEDELIAYSEILRLLSILREESRKWKRLEQIPVKKSREAVDLAIEYMEMNFREKCTLEATAAYAHFSPVYFHGIFKLATGKTPYEYLLSLRLEEAKRLLLTENYPMTQIAERCGFTGQSYFNYVFKKETGQTPSAYRRKMLDSYLKEDGKFRE